MKKLAMIAGLLMASISAMAAPPSVPTGLTAVTNTPTSATLSWNSVTGVGIKYNIYQNGTLLGSNAATTAQVSGLVTGVQYGFGVQAYNINNEQSAVSPYITITAGAGVTPTGQVQNVYCVNCTSGSGGGGGDASAANQVIGNASLASIDAATQYISSTVNVEGQIPSTDNFVLVGGHSGPGTAAHTLHINGSGAISLPVGAASEATLGIVAGALTSTPSISGNVGLNAGVNYIGAVGISGTALNYLQSISSSVASLGSMAIGMIDPPISYVGSQPTLNVSAFIAARNNTTSNIELLSMRQPGLSFNSDASLNVNSTLYARDPTNTTSIPLRYGQQAMTSSLPVVFASDQTRLGVTLTSITATERLGVSVTAALPAGTNYIGAVGISNTVAVQNATGTNYIGAVNISNTASSAVQVAGSITNTVTIQNALNSVEIQTIPYLGITNTTGVSAVQYASITFTATGGSANGITIVAAVSGKTIVVVGYTLSTNTAARLTLHHQGAAAVRSNSASNIIGGGLYPANGGETKDGVWKPGLAKNQPVCLDVSAAVTGLECQVSYVTY